MVDLSLAICVAGLPGSGKSLVSKVAKSYGIKVIVMGDAVRQEALRRGIPFTQEGLGSLMIKLRDEMGAEAIVKLSLEHVSPQDRVVLFEGLRSLAEVEELKKHFRKVVIVAIHAPPEIRYSRLKRRRRSDDPSSWEKFIERDVRELKVGLGEVIALADYMVVNNSSLKIASREASLIFKKLMEELKLVEGLD